MRTDFSNSQDVLKTEIAELKGQMVQSTEEGNKTYAGRADENCDGAGENAGF